MRNVLLSIAIGVTTVGCAGQTGVPDDNDGLAQGLTIFTSDAESGVAGMYAKGELAVFFETVREIELDPAPQHEHFTIDGTPVNVSVRYTDMEGRNLTVALGSHEPPAGWSTAGEPSPAMLAVRPALFDLTLEAGTALELALDDAVAPERHALVLTGVKMRPPTIAPPAARAATFYSDGWDHWQYFEVHSKSCCGVAEHSATVFWNWSESGGWEDGWQTSNHGAYAMEMGLEDDCGGSGVWAGGGRPHYHSDRLQYCDMKNGYNACGVFGGNHNCHDDSKLQRANIVYGAWYGSAPGWCSGWGCDMYAPHCN